MYFLKGAICEIWLELARLLAKSSSCRYLRWYTATDCFEAIFIEFGHIL